MQWSQYSHLLARALALLQWVQRQKVAADKAKQPKREGDANGDSKRDRKRRRHGSESGDEAAVDMGGLKASWASSSTAGSVALCADSTRGSCSPAWPLAPRLGKTCSPAGGVAGQARRG